MHAAAPWRQRHTPVELLLSDCGRRSIPSISSELGYTLLCFLEGLCVVDCLYSMHSMQVPRLPSSILGVMFLLAGCELISTAWRSNYSQAANGVATAVMAGLCQVCVYGVWLGETRNPTPQQSSSIISALLLRTQAGVCHARIRLAWREVLCSLGCATQGRSSAGLCGSSQMGSQWGRGPPRP
jgi:hypothetical protein